MRKNALFAAGMALTILFAACTEKEGVYNPKKKIAKVYASSVYEYGQYDPETDTLYNRNAIRHDKYLSEEWTWEGNKLTQITVYYYIDPSIDKGDAEVIKFTYDGKQVQRIESEDVYMTFTYDGKKLQQIQIFETGSSNPHETYTFYHEGGKITKIDFAFNTIYVNEKAVGQMHRILFRTLLPTMDKAEKAIADLRSTMAKNGSEDMITIPLELTWTGDNVTGLSANYTIPEFVGPVSCTLSSTSEFDNKNNPYQHNLLMGLNNWEEEGAFPCFNKNNVTKTTTETQYGGGYTNTDVYTYSYTYDGQWPLSQTRVYQYHYEDYGCIDSTTLYFEYAK